MTHLAGEIRSSAIEMLSWLLDVAGSEVVSCPGGWVKTLNCFLSLLGWHTQDTAKWSANEPSMSKAGNEAKATARTLQVLAQMLRCGMDQPLEQKIEIIGEGEERWGFPLWDTEQHLLPKNSGAFAYLNLFGAPRDEENDMHDDREDRVRIFDKGFRSPIENGLGDGRKEGGDVGRAAMVVSKVLKEVHQEAAEIEYGEAQQT